MHSSAHAQQSTTPSCNLKWTGLPYDAKGKYHPECEVQILYSWITTKQIIDAKDANWPIRRGRAFFTRSPLASFMYGMYSYRVKLKPGLDFKLEDWDDNHFMCRHPEEEKKHTVYVNHDLRNGFSEYVLCSNEVIDSWSFGTPEQYQEMVRERELIQKIGYKKVDGYIDPNRGPGTHVHMPKCTQCFQGYTMHDARHPGDLATLDRAFELMQESIESKEGAVYIPTTKKIVKSGPEYAAHFNNRILFGFQTRGTQYSTADRSIKLQYTQESAEQ